MKLTSNIEHRTSNIQRPVRPPHSMLDVRGSRFEVSPSASRRACAAGHSPFAIRHSPFQRGIALVITLIMLSVTLVMAVAFLAIANRERNAVTTTTDTATARHGAETALAYAEAQIVANILSSTNAGAYNFSLLVSTNYINGLGFTTGSGNPMNVNYDFLINNGGTLTTANQRNQNIANLWFLPRAPVFIYNRNTGSNDFRFYLDLNRNGRFEPNSAVTNVDNRNNIILDSLGNPVVTSQPGDPEWIGILERPDAPHGPDNKFVARVAFLAQPIGNSLDLNAIHNQTLNPNSNLSAPDVFFRNEGVGSWELNLAAFLADLNPNQWNPVINPYTYQQWMVPPFPNTGAGFDDARALLSWRYANNYNSLAIPPANAYAALVNAGIDGYTVGKLMTNTSLPFVFTPKNSHWAGSDNTNHFFALSSDLFDTSKNLGNFPAHLLNAGTNTFGGTTVPTYDRYTFYRMLDQLGTDSTADSGKMNLNWDNLSPVINGVYNVNGIAATTNFFAWQPLTFFTNAADRMLRTYTANWFAAPTNYLVTYYGY